ncbi:MAG: hypothetical protein V2A70_04640 [Candidatus Omnitrophota bacterium]
MFGFLVLAHLILAKAWIGQHLILRYNNSHGYVTAIAAVFRNMVDSHAGFLHGVVTCQFAQDVGEYWPSLVHRTYLLGLLCLSYKWMFLINFVYLIVIMLGIYFTVRFLIGDRFYSLLAAALFSCYGVIGMQLISCELQLAGMASIVWGFYWYIRSAFFTRLWPVVFFTVCVILAFYCERVTMGLYLGALFFVPQNFKNRRSVLVMALAGLVVLASIWPFYYHWFMMRDWSSGLVEFFDIAGDQLGVVASYKMILNNPTFVGMHILYYFLCLPEMLLGRGFTFLLLVGFWFLRGWKDGWRSVLLFALFVPLAGFILIAKKHYLFIIPLCVYFSMITAIGIFSISRQSVRNLLVGLALVLCAVYSFNTYSSGRPLEKVLFSGSFPFIKTLGVPKLFSWDCFGVADYKRVREMAESIRPFLYPLSGSRKVLMVDLKEYVQQHTLVYLLQLTLEKIAVVNVRFSDHVDPGQWLQDADGYLLSDKMKYSDALAAKDIGGCAYRGVEPVFNLSGSEVVLYKVRR